MSPSLPKCALTKEFNLLITWVVLLSTFTFVYSHVSLTFPRARKFDFDFLDNVRTKAPCGMPKGTETTSLPAGVQFNVTWHLAYPHRGGFRIELLDRNEKLLLNLTQSNSTDGWINDGDVTAQSYPVTLPKTLTCRGCTIRLLRQASEWSGQYNFWSCADVDIIPVTSIITNKNAVCSGNGRFNITDGKCHCNRLYSGIVCQFLDECWTDDDCGNHGSCFRVNTTNPTKQCFCKVGWFGEKCAKESTIKSTEVDLKKYFHRELTQGYDLYWRIIKESEEIEVVLKLLGNGYAAIGWRPDEINESCKAFPYLIDSNVPVVIVDPRNSAPPPAVQPNYDTRRIDILPNESAPQFKKIKVGSKILPDNRLANSSGLGSRQPKSSDSLLSTVSSVSSPPALAESVPVTVSSSEPSVSPASSEPEPAPEAEASPKPKNSTPDDSSKVKSETEPEPKGEPKPEPVAPTSEPEPSSSAEPEPKNEGEPAIVESLTEPSAAEPSDRDGKSDDSVPEPESEVKPTVEPAASEIEPVKPEGEPVKPEAKPEPEVIDEPVSEAEPKVTTEPEPSSSEPQPKESEIGSAKPEGEPEPEPEPEKISSPIEKSQFHPGSFLRVSLDSEIKIRNKRQSGPDVGTGAIPAGKRRALDGWKNSDYPPVTDYTPVAGYHAMDCNDVVIGSAIQQYGRVLDYYTRDRSTPRVDSFFGGKDDLTGAIAFESDGYTTIIFRKKLIAEELTDHSILNKSMNVIWAKGQEHQKYVHSPPSGLEKDKPKKPNFYGRDEIKYHGHGNQRGSVRINFYEEPKAPIVVSNNTIANETAPVGLNVPSLPCNGEYRYPKDCKGRKCDYLFSWKYNEDLDGVDFAVSAKRIDKWTGIGFSKNKLMPNTDVVIAWVEPGGRYLMMDAWLEGYSQPKPDIRQSIFNISALNENGLITFKFSRKLNTLDTRHDISLNECVHFVYPVSGGPVDSSRKNIRKHLQSPIVSEAQVCFGKCKDPSSTPEPNVPKSSAAPEPEVSSKPESVPETKPEPKPEAESKPVKPTPESEPPSAEPGVKPEPLPKVEPESSAKPEPGVSPKSVPKPEPENKIETRYGTVCSGEWKYPANCTGYGCDYQIAWEYMDDNDDIQFNLQTKNTNRWTGIGFSNNKLMPQTDVILGLVEESGRFFLMDTWLNDYNTPPLDKKQDIHNSSAWRENGITHLKFHRYRKTNDPKDFEFSDHACPYFVFPIRGGVFNAVNKRIRKHEAVPIISEDRVCVKSCKPKPPPAPVSSSPKPEPEPEPEPEVVIKSESKPPTTETEPKPEAQPEKPVAEVKPPHVENTTQSTEPSPSPSTPSSTTCVTPDEPVTTIKSVENEIGETMVVLEIKMPNAWKPSLSQRNSADYRKLMTKLEDHLEKELQDNGHVPKQIEVTDISGVGESGVLATVKVEVANTTESRARLDKPIISIREALNQTIKDGKVGNLIVDPSYLIFKSPDVFEVSGESNETKKAGLSSEQLTYLAIIVGLSSLVILCISQALCMVWRDKSNKEKKMKEKAMANSHYKDYSATTTSSAYSYENFAVQDDPDGVGYKPMNGKANGNSKPDSGNGKKKGSKGSSNGMSNYNSATVDRADSKTSTFGYPSAYATHDRKDNNTFRYISQPQPLTPDFYFMPHQRRYSGEVVRVFVDYNNPQFMPK